MNDFELYFKLGWEHIMSIAALDHLLFITTLTSIYLLLDWKKVLILITAFTLGHTLTLFLSVLDFIQFNKNVVEFLIPLTIVITAIVNFFPSKWRGHSQKIKYLIALSFGLIHGMGFANSIRWMMASSQHLLIPLASFNIGIEVAQALVVVLVLFIGTLLIEKFRIKSKWRINLISGTAGLIALMMCLQRLPL